ncbi:hypothetical protein BC941DRAFT_436630, partial [Chlamydoabsidia padenii]
MALKKFRGIEWTESEKRTLKGLDEGSPFLNVNLVLSRAVISLLMNKQSLTGVDLSVLKLSLSGIVNQLNTDQFIALKPYLPKKFDQSHVDHVVDKIKCYEMKNDTSAMYDSILDIMESENSPIELALLQINTLKAKFLMTEGRKTEGYIMLKVVEYLLETLNDWKQDDSETTIYRRIATIFDFMFHDTHVKLADGETACDRSKHERQYNDIVYGSSSTDRELCGRKIDLLIRYGRDTKDLELSSNEFKKPSVTTSNAITQQCKNLRVNSAILNHLYGLNKNIDSLLAMDWIGSSGYLYCLIAHHGVYVAKLVDILTIPTSVNGLLEFKNTLRLLFAYKVLLPSSPPPQKKGII